MSATRPSIGLGMLALSACAESHGRIEGPPLYVHLCAEMSEADQELWGLAAGDVNAEQGDQVVRVGHGPVPTGAGCGFIDVCSSPDVREGVEWRGSCVITLRYVRGEGAGSAYLALSALLKELP